MGEISFVHWFIVLSVFLIPLFPIIRILRRAGHSGWWSILYFLPLVGWIGLWIFAYARWPAFERAGQTETF